MGYKEPSLYTFRNQSEYPYEFLYLFERVNSPNVNDISEL